jgi:hypothetical protein
MFGTILAVVVGAIIVLLAAIWLVGERGRLLMPSTLKFFREGGLSRLLSLGTLHGYIHMRWRKSYTRLSVNQIGPRSSQAARKWWADQYHSKVLTEQQAKSLISM